MRAYGMRSGDNGCVERDRRDTHREQTHATEGKRRDRRALKKRGRQASQHETDA